MPFQSQQLYFLAASCCLALAAGVLAADANQLSAVSGAVTCDTPCHNDTYVRYECHHFVFAPPYPAGCPADCTKCPFVAQSAKGCLKNTITYSFCAVHSGSGGGVCPTKNANGTIAVQEKNMNADCTSSTNGGGSWNNMDPGDCEFQAHLCTDYETTGCPGPLVMANGSPRVGNRAECDNP